MKYQIKADVCRQCDVFLSQKLARIEFRHLQYFRVCDTTKTSVTVGVWGSCRYPSNKANVDYRIPFCVSLSSSDFPYPAKFAIGMRRLDAMRWESFWRDDQFHTLEEAFVWIAGHEAFHGLRHSRQIAGRSFETQANRFGFAWLDEWRPVAATSEGRVK